MKKLVLLLGSLAMVLAVAPAMAQVEEAAVEGERYTPEGPAASYEVVRGTILDVSPAHDSIRLEGADGSLTDFEVPPETPVYYAPGDAPTLTSTRDDLGVGQEVEVGFYLPEVEIMIYPPRRIADQITIFA
jgi:hypothetical protein